MPGAYLAAMVQNTAEIGLVVDGTANRGCPAVSMPVVEYSVDQGPFQVVQLTKAGEVYTLPLAGGLDGRTPHHIEVYFRAADLTRNRWKSSTARLRIAGLALDAGGSLLLCPARPKRAIGFGDSITEGVGADGLFTSWQSLKVNSARAAWFPLVCAALDCQYGQLGSGGQGMVRTLELPPLGQTWHRYDSTTSRLTGGRLLPEPDYIFCCMGTNDFARDVGSPIDITQAYSDWLIAMRRACPTARIFCIPPPLGWHASEITAAVAARRRDGDGRVYLIDIAPLAGEFRAGKGATRLADDGVHPSAYGHAMLATLIAVEVQKALK